MSKNQALYLLKTIWPEAPVDEQVKAAMICHQYQLNPLMRQVYLVQFGKDWVTVLGIKASRQIAQQHHKYSYLDGPRVMTEEERRKILGDVEADRIWAITVLKDSEGNIYPGYGFWPKDKQPYGGDKGNSARNMAFIRSERNALDKMAPGELPDIEATDEVYTPVGNIQVAIAEGKKEFEQQGEQDKIDLYGPAPEKPKTNGSAGTKTESPKPTDVKVSEPMQDLFKKVREKRKSLRTDKNVMDYLTGPCGVKGERIDTEPDKVWEEIKDLL
jgi:hypothetical protein